MARFISIFPFILVCFLTIVSKDSFANCFSRDIFNEELLSVDGKDSVNWILKDDFEDGNISDWENVNDWEVSPVDKINGNFSF